MSALVKVLVAVFFIAPQIGFSEAERPKLPTPGEDTVLMGGKSAAEFFSKRQEDSQCGADLKAARSSYQELVHELKSLVASSASATEIEAKETESRRARTALLRLVNQCGECAARPVEKVKVPAGGKTEYWYITDGSCYLGDQPGPEKRFENARKLFLNTKNYARQNGGFFSILECFGINPTTQEKLPYGEITTFPYPAFMAVKGPLGQSFNYQMDVTQESQTTANGASWTLSFLGSKAPLKFQNEVYEVSASGRKKKTSPFPLSDVHGMWHTSSNGYFRYHTAADFRMPLGNMMDNFATETLLDALLELTEKTAEGM